MTLFHVKDSLSINNGFSHWVQSVLPDPNLSNFPWLSSRLSLLLVATFQKLRTLGLFMTPSMAKITIVRKKRMTTCDFTNLCFGIA